VRIFSALCTAHEGKRLPSAGCGVRRIAQLSGASVVGVDITREYVQAARDLTRRLGLEDRVSFHHGDIVEHRPASPYDAAVTMHVQMNVADKKEWYSAIASRLAPRARLATWEIVSEGEAALAYPMPWSMDGSDSHVVSTGALHTAISSAGVSPVTWVDDTQWVRERLAAAFVGAAPAGPGLVMMLDDGAARVLDLAAVLQSGGLQVYRGAFVKE